MKNHTLFNVMAVVAVLFAALLVYGSVAHNAQIVHLAYLAGLFAFGAYTYGPQSQIMSAQEAQGKNTNSIMSGWVDRGPWQYWDTITGNAGAVLASTYSPFSVPIGQQNPLPGPATKTKLQTNMVRGNQFPPPRCLLLIQIGFYFSSTMIGSEYCHAWRQPASDRKPIQPVPSASLLAAHPDWFLLQLHHAEVGYRFDSR